ncbi:MAG: MarR family winged helix-turn-helix transcriptional regulator [Terriglobales bacterium]
MPSSEPAQQELESALAVAGFLQLTKCTLLIQRRVAVEADRQFSLGAREVWILLAARSQQPVTQKQIAKHLALNENVLVLLLDRLETSGHVRRVRNPANRREQFVRLTATGKSVARRVLAARARFYRTVFAPLDETTIQMLLKAAQDVLSFEATRTKPARRSG